jgi:hypothetical protein
MRHVVLLAEHCSIPQANTLWLLSSSRVISQQCKDGQRQGASTDYGSAIEAGVMSSTVLGGHLVGAAPPWAMQCSKRQCTAPQVLSLVGPRITSIGTDKTEGVPRRLPMLCGAACSMGCISSVHVLHGMSQWSQPACHALQLVSRMRRVVSASAAEALLLR